MKKQLLLLFAFFAFSSVWLNAQDVVLFDWETSQTSVNGKFSFGNGHFGSDTFGIVDNPDVTGINTSAKVGKWCKANDGKSWGGVYFDAPTPIDMTGSALTLCMDVLMPHNGNVLLKLENGKMVVDNDTVEVDVSLVEEYTGDGKWQQLCFDFTLADSQGDVAVGLIFPGFTIFMDFGNVPSDDECHYYDNLIQREGPKPYLSGDVLVDWESDGISVNGTGAFGNGHFADSTFSAVANPLPSGHNKSDSVYQWCKAFDGKSWGGIYFDISPSIFLEGNKTTLCLDVLMPHDGNILLKVEKSTDGGGDASLVAPYTGNGKWQQVCFDYTQPDSDGDVGAGYTYTRFTIFPDFGNVPAEDECHYFDNLTQVSVTKGFDGEVIADWETPETTPGAFVFGKEATIAISPNPKSDEINSSDSTFQFCKNENSPSWAGFAFNIDTLDITGDVATVCLSVYADVANTVRLKLEGATDGSENVSMDRDYSTPGAWQVLCYDLTEPGVDDKSALGHLYTKMTIFPDFGIVPAAETCYYIDDIKKSTNGTGKLLEFISNILSKSPDHSMFSGFIDAVDLSEVVNANGVTVFAPTNDAFNALPTDELNKLTNNIDNALYNMIFHHVTFDSIPPELLVDGTHIMRNGQDGVIVGNKINGANITDSKEAVNGFVHTIESVMTFPTDPDVYNLINFDSDDNGNTIDDWWWWLNGGHKAAQVVDNPLKEGINTSDNVMEVKRFPEGVWYQGIAIKVNRPFNFFNNMTKVCMDIYADKGGDVFLKYDAALGNGIKTGYRGYYSGGNTWETICWDVTKDNFYTDPPNSKNLIYDQMTYFFDGESKELPADTIVYYVDNFRVLNSTVSTLDIGNLEGVSLYPNPVNNTITLTSQTPIYSANIFDIRGHKVMTIKNPLRSKIDVSLLPNGLYLIDLYSDNNRRLGTAKFIKE